MLVGALRHVIFWYLDHTYFARNCLEENLEMHGFVVEMGETLQSSNQLLSLKGMHFCNSLHQHIIVFALCYGCGVCSEVLKRVLFT